MKIIGVNGIATDGAGNTDVLLKRLARLGYDTVDVQLPKRHFFSARWGAKKDAQLVVDNSDDGDVVVAHSFGCLRTAFAMRRRSYRAVFLIAPAMSKNYRFPMSSTDIYAFHSREDMAIRAGALLLFHPFGLAGRHGFNDPMVTNVHRAGGHNSYFEEGLNETVSYIVNRLC